MRVLGDPLENKQRRKMFETNDYWEEEFIGYDEKNFDSIYFDDCTL